MTTTAALRAINPAPHLLDPAETRVAAARYAEQCVADLDRAIAEHKRAIEHEQAILAGYEDARAIRAERRRANGSGASA